MESSSAAVGLWCVSYSACLMERRSALVDERTSTGATGTSTSWRERARGPPLSSSLRFDYAYIHIPGGQRFSERKGYPSVARLNPRTDATNGRLPSEQVPVERNRVEHDDSSFGECRIRIGKRLDPDSNRVRKVPQRRSAATVAVHPSAIVLTYAEPRLLSPLPVRRRPLGGPRL
ncbi:hypothetical protein ISCGN_012355 [Ixodes scapularis]